MGRLFLLKAYLENGVPCIIINIGGVMFFNKKKREVEDKIAKLRLLDKTCYNCKKSYIVNETRSKGVCTSSCNINPCLIYHDQRHGVCELWEE